MKHIAESYKNDKEVLKLVDILSNYKMMSDFIIREFVEKAKEISRFAKGSYDYELKDIYEAYLELSLSEKKGWKEADWLKWLENNWPLQESNSNTSTLKHVKLFEQFVNESSTLTNLGVSSAAISAYYNKGENRFFIKSRLSADATYISYKGKSALETQIKSSGVAPVVIFTLDGQGGMTVASRSNDSISERPYYRVSEIQADGTIEKKDSGLTISKAISALPRSKEYYLSNSRVERKRTEYDNRKSEVGETLKTIVNSSTEILKGDIADLVAEYKAKALELMQNGDIEGANRILNGILYDERRGYGRPKMKELDINAMIRSDYENELISAFRSAIEYNLSYTAGEEAKKLEEMIKDYRYGNLDSLAPIKKYAYALAVDFIKRKRRWLEATTEYKTR